MKEVVVFGSNHHNSLGIVRSFGEAGLKVRLVLVGVRGFVAKSKYASEVHCFDTLTKCVDYISSCCRPAEGRGVIYSAIDETTWALDCRREELAPYFYLPVCDEPGRVRKLMNKATMTALAKNCDIAVPDSWEVRNRVLDERITFPCITKPLASVAGSKSDIVRCNTLEELASVVESPHHCGNFLVQQFVEKDYEICLLGIVLHQSREVVFSGCVRKLRNADEGGTLYAVLEDSTALKGEQEKLANMMRRTGYSGVFSAEYVCKEGVCYFVEVNFRNDATGYASTFAGMNMPYIWFQSCYEKEVAVPAQSQMRTPCYFMNEVSDLRLAVNKHKVTLIKWLKDYRHTDCRLIYDPHDRAPLREVIRSIIRRKGGKG